jgi:hypothetical protein
MRRVSDTKNLAVLESPNEAPNMTGQGDIDYVCPKCRHLIIRGKPHDVVIPDVAFKCFKCESLLIIPRDADKDKAQRRRKN